MDRESTIKMVFINMLEYFVRNRKTLAMRVFFRGILYLRLSLIYHLSDPPSFLIFEHFTDQMLHAEKN